MRYLSLCIMFLATLLTLAGETEREEDIYTSLGGHYAASHILIQFRRAEKAPDSMDRSKKDASAKAEKILAELQTHPERFETLARAESDGPSAVKGGYLGGFNRGDMAPKFEAMVKKLAEGELAPKVVKTGFGYHVIRRESSKQRNYGVAAILVAHEGATKLRVLEKHPEVYERTPENAKAQIQQAKRMLADSNFAEVASKYSDLQKDGGFFGIFRKGEGPLSDDLVNAVSSLEIGEHGDIVSLPVGQAILQRRAVVRYQAARIWIGHRDVERLPKKTQRTPEAAAKLAEELASTLKADPSQFDALAKKHSAGPFSSRGGLMAPWFKGLQEAEFEKAVAALEVGELNPSPIKTKDGYFIIKRLH